MVLKWKNNLEGKSSSITTASEDLENSGSSSSSSSESDSSDDSSTNRDCIDYMAATVNVSPHKARSNRYTR